MSTQLLFYQNAVPVSAERHKDLAVKAGLSYAFAAKVNSVPLTAIEFAQAAAEYPIVFAGNEDAVMPAVILGAAQTENLFINQEGSWTGKYIPAFVRRYPFVFSADEAGKTFVLHIDEDFEGVNRQGRGERLFDNDGQQTQYLKGVLSFLQDYQARFRRTRQYCERLTKFGLLQPMQAQFNLTSGERRSLSGFMTVSREKLKALSSAERDEMFQNDELECTYLHLHSLRHFGDMVERIATQAEPSKLDAPLGGGDTDIDDDVKPPARGSAKRNGAEAAA